MNNKDRFNSVVHFKPVDRVPFIEMRPWDATYIRWREEGMPISESEKIIPKTKPGESMGEIFGMGSWSNLKDRFNLTKVETLAIDADIIPKFKEQILSEESNQRIRIDERGRTIKERIDDPMLSMPEFIDFPIKNREDFHRYVRRYNPLDPKRLPKNLNKLIDNWNKRDYPLRIGDYPAPWSLFGSIRELVGFKKLMLLFYDDIIFLEEMMEFFTEYCLQLLKKIMPLIKVDYIWLWEDMAYKTGSMISPQHFRKFMMPKYKKMVDYIRSQGVDTIIVDSDGKIDELISLWLESGINGIEPLEIQCGNDPIKLRKLYGNELVMLGGIDKRMIAKGEKEIKDELMSKVPFLINKGGYIPMLDHDVPPDISWKNFVFYRETLNHIAEGK